jgi:nucleotide-binding universal stress UspA family protein
VWDRSAGVELRASGVPVRCRLVEGSAVTALLQAAEDESADLIVVGSRGAGGFSDLHLGSTSHQVALYADRPVTVIPPPGRARPPLGGAGSQADSSGSS